MPPVRRVRVGVVGFGHLGQYLTRALLHDDELRAVFELAFVWNRSPAAVDACSDPLVPPECRLRELDAFAAHHPDLVVEVAHPAIVQQYGGRFVEHCHLLVGSPTAFADAAVETTLSRACVAAGHALFVPCGALWGGTDIQRMADRGTLRALTITMKKHPTSWKVTDELVAVRDAAVDVQDESVLFCGPVRRACALAPNNVNTMAAAAIAGHSLGFDGVVARLVADPRLNTHVVEVDVTGPETPGYGVFRSRTVRENPAPPGHVTGAATYTSFRSSLLAAARTGMPPGVHFC